MKERMNPSELQDVHTNGGVTMQVNRFTEVTLNWV